MRAVFDRALWWGKWCGCDFVSTLSLTRFHFLFVFNAAAVLSFICCRLPSLPSLDEISPFPISGGYFEINKWNWEMVERGHDVTTPFPIAQCALHCISIDVSASVVESALLSFPFSIPLMAQRPTAKLLFPSPLSSYCLFVFSTPCLSLSRSFSPSFLLYSTY